jgi:hypothetical protein
VLTLGHNSQGLQELFYHYWRSWHTLLGCTSSMEIILLIVGDRGGYMA